MLSNQPEILKAIPAKRRFAKIADQLVKQGQQPTQAKQNAATRMKPKLDPLNKTVIQKRGTP